MYNVLIADDEPIILSGIKFLIDWEKNGCSIIDTARNGQEALEKIRACQPDIVLCDIKMPVMDGISLLKTVSSEFPSVVFVMLSNLQEFKLAQEALSYRAVEYLLKSDLEAELLEKALEKAKKESDQRSVLDEASHRKYYDTAQQKETIHNACLDFLLSPGKSALAHAESVLQQNHMLDGYGLLYIPFDFSGLPDFESPDSQSPASLTAWEKELAARIADNIFDKKYLFVQTGQEGSLTMFLWGQGSAWEEQISLFDAKFASASENIARVQPAVCPTGCFYGPEQMTACRNAYFQRIDDFYLYENTGLSMETIERRPFEPLGLSGIGSQLEEELNSRNLTGCTLLFEKAMNRLKTTYHQKSQAVWLCNELYRSVAKVLPGEVFDDNGYRRIKTLKTRNQILHWLMALNNSLADYLNQNTGALSKSVMLEKARMYVYEHAEEQISLQDAADHVCISPGYLSTLFKKQYNQSFVNFVNQVKIEKACELILGSDLLVNEIAFRLGYENAYYFARVFRKYTGMSPSEWKKNRLHQK